MALTLWRNAKLASLSDGSPWGLIDRGAMLVDEGTIQWIGEDARIPPNSANEIDLGGALVTPGLIDCHTHLVYGGHRAAEFELRLQGASYEEIARSGGGIRSTVKATRAASDETLFQTAKVRAQTLMSEGVTSLEVKSGYGLSLHDEARSLRAARRLASELPVSVFTTYLGAHAVPPEYEGRADEYITAVCEWLPALATEGLVDAVDAFCERIGFTVAQTRRVFDAAKALGLPVKLHAEQLSDSGGAQLAAEFGALSCDHIEYLSQAGVEAMAKTGTVAVLLPGAYYFLRETQKPPIEALRAAGVPMALASDHNPGSSPGLSLLLMLNMACTFFRLTPEEALRGVTVNAAKALGLNDRGTLAEGMRADFTVWNVEHPNELAYWFGRNPCSRVVVGGVER